MGISLTVNRLELKRMLSVLGVSEKNTDELLADLNRMHRHVNAVAFSSMLLRLGLNNDDVANVLRRIGIDDITISSIFNVLDEEKIKSTYGRVVDIQLE
jgi:hypothetical protein